MTLVQPRIRHPLHLRKDPEMQFVEQRLQQVQAQQAEFRRQRQAERLAMAAPAERRPVRRQVGERIIRLGHRVAGEGLRSPALSR